MFKVVHDHASLGCNDEFWLFNWNFVIFGIGNEYQYVHADLYELKSDFSEWLCEEKIASMWLSSCQ